MTLKIKTKDTDGKIKPKVKTEPKVDIQVKVEEYVLLKAKVDKFNATIAKQESVLKKEIVALVNQSTPDGESREFVTAKGIVTVGKRGSSRSITNMEKAIEFLGEDTFLKVAKVSMADFDKYLRPEEIEQCVVTKTSDTRIVKVKK